MADYYTLLKRAVAYLPKTTPPSTRKAIYIRASKALSNQLRSLMPKIPERDILREERALYQAVSKLEAELEMNRGEATASDNRDSFPSLKIEISDLFQHFANSPNPRNELKSGIDSTQMSSKKDDTFYDLEALEAAMARLLGKVDEKLIHQNPEEIGDPKIKTPVPEKIKLPNIKFIPKQNENALFFTPALSGPLDLKPENRDKYIDPQQSEIYALLRRQIKNIIEQTPSQELNSILEPLQEFAAQPEQWKDIKFKKILWLCGNTLRNIIAQHDATIKDPDPHYAKLPPAVAEALRRPVETWNVLILGDSTLRNLDQQRLGPKEFAPASDRLSLAKPILHNAANDRNVTTDAAGEAIAMSVRNAQSRVNNVHTRQAQHLTQRTAENLVVEILRGAYKVAEDLQNPTSEEAKIFAKEFKSGIYKKIGEAALLSTIAGTVGTAYYFGAPFLEFVGNNADALKAFVAGVFHSSELNKIVDSIISLRQSILRRQ